MNIPAILAAIALVAGIKVMGEVISISGTVVNRQTNGVVRGALVSLEGETLSTLADSTGKFILSGTVGIINPPFSPAPSTAYPVARGIVFTVPSNASVALSIYSFDGKLAFSLFKRGVGRGQWLFSPRLRPGAYTCKAQVNNSASVFKYFAPDARMASFTAQRNGDPTLSMAPPEGNNSRLHKFAAASYTLLASKTGFVTNRILVPGPTATGVSVALDSIGALKAEPAMNFKGFNWADQRDNFADDILYISGLSPSSTYASAQALAAMVLGTWRGVGANTVRLPINPQTVSSSFWSVYKGVIDKATSMGFKVILCPWDSKSRLDQRIDDMNLFWAMWSTVTTDYNKNSLVYFEMMNEPYYDPAAWRLICDGWLSRNSTIPNGRVIIAACGRNGERNSNQMGVYPEFDGCLLANHLYNPWDGTSTDSTYWYNLAASQIDPYAERTIMTEYGQSMSGGIDYMGPPNANAVVAYMAGITRYMREHKMGGTHWAGLRDGDGWSLYKRNGVTSLTLTNASGLARVKYSWGM